MFQREARTPLFVVGWLATIACFFIEAALHAPPVIRTGIFVVILWTPLQFAINYFVTKASVHASLVAISFTGLWTLGYLAEPLLFGISLLIVIAVSWARMKTRNHTPTQIILGLLTGTLATLVAFLIFQ